jgi:hypothetical protein
MNVRSAARGLALNRLAFGLNYVVRPDAVGQSWIGAAAARRAGTQVLARGLGARDVALGAGALAALHRGDDDAARRWMAAHAVADGVDLVATVVARDGLPPRQAVLATLVAAASTAVGAWSAVALRSG